MMSLNPGGRHRNRWYLASFFFIRILLNMASISDETTVAPSWNLMITVGRSFIKIIHPFIFEGGYRVQDYLEFLLGYAILLNYTAREIEFVLFNYVFILYLTGIPHVQVLLNGLMILFSIVRFPSKALARTIQSMDCLSREPMDRKSLRCCHIRYQSLHWLWTLGKAYSDGSLPVEQCLCGLVGSFFHCSVLRVHTSLLWW